MLAAADRGMPRGEVARTFGVSVSTVKRYLRLRRETGGVEAKKIPGPPARKRTILEEGLPAQVRLNPDLTLEEHCELFEEERGVAVSASTMSRALKDLGLPLKKDARLLRARRRREGGFPRASGGSGPEDVRVGGRVRHPHLHDAAAGAGP